MTHKCTTPRTQHRWNLIGEDGLPLMRRAVTTWIAWGQLRIRFPTIVCMSHSPLDFFQWSVWLIVGLLDSVQAIFWQRLIAPQCDRPISTSTFRRRGTCPSSRRYTTRSVSTYRAMQCLVWRIRWSWSLRRSGKRKRNSRYVLLDSRFFVWHKSWWRSVLFCSITSLSRRHFRRWTNGVQGIRDHISRILNILSRQHALWNFPMLDCTQIQWADQIWTSWHFYDHDVTSYPISDLIRRHCE